MKKTIILGNNVEKQRFSIKKFENKFCSKSVFSIQFKQQDLVEQDKGERSMEYWKMSADWSEEYLQTFEPVLHSVLRGYHVSTTNSEYQALLQLGRILILETFQKLGGNPLEEQRYIYAAYIKRGFSWICLREFSKENQQKMRECSDENLEFMLGKDTSIQGQLEMNELLEELYSVLTPRQKKTLELFLEQSDSIKELAKLEGRCKSKYYRDRQAIQKKYQQYIRGGESNGGKNQ